MIASTLINASWLLAVTCIFCEAQGEPKAPKVKSTWRPIESVSIVADGLASRLLSNSRQTIEHEASRFYLKRLSTDGVVYINANDMVSTRSAINPKITAPDPRFNEPTAVLQHKEGVFYVFNCGEFGCAAYWVDAENDESTLVSKLPINDLVEFEGKVYFAYGHYNLQDPGGVGVIERINGHWRLKTVYKLPSESAQRLLFTKDKKIVAILTRGVQIYEKENVINIEYSTDVFLEYITNAALDEDDNIILGGSLFLRRLSKSSGYRNIQYLLPGEERLQDYIDAFEDR